MQIYVITFPVYHSSRGYTLYGRFYKGHMHFFFDAVVGNVVINMKFVVGLSYFDWTKVDRWRLEFDNALAKVF